MDDTSPEAQARYFELLRDAGPLKRLQTCADLSSATRELAVAGIRAAHQGIPLSEDQVRELLAERLYGRDAAQRFFEAGRGGEQR